MAIDHRLLTCEDAIKYSEMKIHQMKFRQEAQSSLEFAQWKICWFFGVSIYRSRKAMFAKTKKANHSKESVILDIKQLLAITRLIATVTYCELFVWSVKFIVCEIFIQRVYLIEATNGILLRHGLFAQFLPTVIVSCRS